MREINMQITYRAFSWGCSPRKFNQCLLLLAIPLFCFGQRAELSIPFGHTAAIRSLSFSEDGRYLLSGATDGTLKLWDIETGTLLKTSDNLDHSIEQVVLSADAQFAGYVWAESDNQKREPRWWNIPEDTHSAGLPVPEGFTAVAKRLANQPPFRQNIHPLPDSSLIKHFLRQRKTRSEWTNIQISPDSTAIACGLANGSIELYELESGRLQQVFRAYTLEGSYVQFSPDNQSVYVGDHSGRLWAWDFERGGVTKVVGQANDGRHQSTFFWPVSGQQQFYRARDRTLELLDLEQNTVQFLKKIPDDGTEVHWLGFSEPLKTVYLQVEVKKGTSSLKAWELRDSGIVERNLSYKQLATVRSKEDGVRS